MDIIASIWIGLTRLSPLMPQKKHKGDVPMQYSKNPVSKTITLLHVVHPSIDFSTRQHSS
jgi:hypothetical protein